MATVFSWLCLLYGWQAWGNAAPWLNIDEFERAQLSRAVASSGHEAWRGVPQAFDSLYVYLTAPAWWLHDTTQAYGVVKAIGVVTMTAVAFPTYLLARTVVSKGWALFAATGAATIPALAYSSMLLLEPLAYPWVALCFYLIARALVTCRPAWIASAVAACLVAPLVRSQLFLVPVGAVAAGVLFWFKGESGRHVRSNWNRWDWALFMILVVSAVVAGDAIAVHYSHTWAVATQDYPGRMVKYGLRSAGSLTIGLGIVPVIAGLIAVKAPRGEPASREHRAFASLVVAMVCSFGLYAAAKAAYIPTLGVTEFVERNIIYLAPLLFVGTALVIGRRRAPLVPLFAATAFALYVVATTPYHLDVSAFFDAPGLAGLAGLHRAFGLTSTDAKILLIAFALVSAGIVLFVRLSTGRRASAVAVISAGLVLSWNMYGEISFARASHTYASGLLDNMPRPLNWVDRALPNGAEAYYLGQSIDDPNDVLQLEFWNTSLKHIWSTDGTAPAPGPTVVPGLVAADGSIEPATGVEYMVADSGVSPVGQVIERKVHHGGRGPRTWTLLRITPPLRLRQSIEGVYPDGWGKPVTALNQFSLADGSHSVVRVHVFRTGAARRYPAEVRVTIGTLGLVGFYPATATLVAARTLHVRNNLDHTFVLDAPPPPFRVETSVTPFPHDRDPRIGDPRDLGANVVYTVQPA